MNPEAAFGVTTKHAKHAKGIGRKAGLMLFVCFACFVVEVRPALAIPVEVHEGGVAFTVPDGFEEMAPLTNEADVVRLFARRPSATADPDTWLTIRQQAGTGAVDAATAETGLGVLGRYSERLHGLDVAVLQDRLMTNEAVYLQSRAQLPVGAATLLVNLKSRSMEDREMKELMRAVLASAADQPADSENGFNDWIPLFICLGLAAALLIIAIGRR